MRTVVKPTPVAWATPSSTAMSSVTVSGMPPKPCESTVSAKSPLNALPNVSRISVRMLAASALNAVTSATPINTGAAVRDVRLGLRAAFWRAIEPLTPRNLATGTPMKSATGRAIAGPSTKMPANTPSTPRPSTSTGASFIAATSPMAPSATSPRPINTRRRRLPAVSSAVSRIAASGGTRPARRAGSQAANTVTTTPAMSVFVNDDGLIASPRVGTSNPVACNKAFRPCDKRMPMPNPISEPITPIASDSTSIARDTCLRLAPMARMRAFSRCRCAAVMENTL